MDLLVTLDQNYLGPLRVLLGSLFLNDPGEEFHIYMIEEGLTGAQVEELSQLCRAHHSQLHPLEVPDGLFTDAPVVRYYSRAMYYRLLAAELLPRELDRVLYLDPDILVIRPVRPLYETQLGDSLLAAATDWPTRRDFSSGRAGKSLPEHSGYSSASTRLASSRTRSPPLPDMTRPRSSTCLQ